jgi:anti-sigma factor RsiW
VACSGAWLEVLSAWHDGEATGEEVARARLHVAGCHACGETLERFRRLRTALRSLPDEGAPAPSPRRAAALCRPAPRRALAAGLAAAAVALAVWVAPRRVAAGLDDELEAHHLRAFSRASPCEFESSDAAAVRGWLKAHVGYDVEVPTIPGAKLLGARRCKVRGVLTASLLYRHGDDALTVFLPRAGTPAEAEAARLAGSSPACTVARNGDQVCAGPGRFAVAETIGTALAALHAS